MTRFTKRKAVGICQLNLVKRLQKQEREKQAVILI
jgi:hypothetical protein